jgi:hypothetical protein
MFYHHFLELNGLAKLPAMDVEYLQSKGCFQVPVGQHLDAFIHEYFLHVHPYLPVVDESQFWAAYKQEDGRHPGSKVSLLLFQAMIFAASVVGSLYTRSECLLTPWQFVPQSSLTASGFEDSHEAHTVLHQRAAVSTIITC